MTEKEIQECAANPTCECVIAVALSAARSVEKAYPRAESLRDIGLAQVKLGDKESARDTVAAVLFAARGIVYAGYRAAILRDIALMGWLGKSKVPVVRCAWFVGSGNNRDEHRTADIATDGLEKVTP